MFNMVLGLFVQLDLIFILFAHFQEPDFKTFSGLFNGTGHPGLGGRYNIYNNYVGPSSVATSTNGDYGNYDEDYSVPKHYTNNSK
jgi:hypothetical protein